MEQRSGSETKRALKHLTTLSSVWLIVYIMNNGTCPRTHQRSCFTRMVCCFKDIKKSGVFCPVHWGRRAMNFNVTEKHEIKVLVGTGLSTELNTELGTAPSSVQHQTRHLEVLIGRIARACIIGLHRHWEFLPPRYSSIIRTPYAHSRT